jgi:hypothetical protein
MKQPAWAFAGLVAVALSLGACSKQADQAPNAPGSPGAGNSTEVVKPSVADGSSGAGPSGIAGSAPHTGASGGDVVAGTTGKGLEASDGRSAPAQAGIGLNGGLGNGSGAAMGNAAAGNGSPNTTSSSAVGQR